MFPKGPELLATTTTNESLIKGKTHSTWPCCGLLGVITIDMVPLNNEDVIEWAGVVSPAQAQAKVVVYRPSSGDIPPYEIRKRNTKSVANFRLSLSIIKAHSIAPN